VPPGACKYTLNPKYALCRSGNVTHPRGLIRHGFEHLASDHMATTHCGHWLASWHSETRASRKGGVP